MTTSSARKGSTAELELARLLTDRLGGRIRRKLGAGRNDDEGDIEGITDTTVEVKNYPTTGIAAAINDGLNDLLREQLNAGTTHGVLFVKRPRAGWIAVMTLNQWCTLHREAMA